MPSFLSKSNYGLLSKHSEAARVHRAQPLRVLHDACPRDAYRLRAGIHRKVEVTWLQFSGFPSAFQKVIHEESVFDFYDLDTLGPPGVRENRTFGPYLKLQSYDAATGAYVLSVVLVRHVPPDAQTASQQPSVVWSIALDEASAKRSDTTAAAGEVIHTWRGWQFWRFVVKTSLEASARRLTYTVEPYLSGRRWEVCLPSLSESWHWAFYSCNGLLDPADAERAGHIQPLWRDLLARHAERPFHLMVGGGDQLYNDGAFSGPVLKAWDQGTPEEMKVKLGQPFSEQARAEVETFYFAHYCHHFAQPVYRDALASIPSINAWDDHDIFDGYGSYPDALQSAPVMQGVYGAARLFFLLFQLHTTDARLQEDGYWTGPGANMLLQLGPDTAMATLDARSQRTITQIVPEEVYGQLEQRLRALPKSVRHVVLVLPVPIAYPRLPVQGTLQAISALANGHNALSIIAQKTGLAGLLTQRFGMPFILDDIIDHWDATQHVAERDRLLRMLMDYSKFAGVRVSCISGDVHCAGYGMFCSRQQQAKDGAEGNTGSSSIAAAAPPPEQLKRDPCFIPQIISSAIGNLPPPNALLRALEVVAMLVEPILEDCEQRMVPLFGPSHLSTSMLHGRRNWCEVAQAADGSSVLFNLRCEKELGSGKVDVFTVDVPLLEVD